MAFKFRMEKILKIREDEVEQARLVVKNAENAVAQTHAQITKTQQEIRERNNYLIETNYDMAQDHLRCIKVCKERLEKLKIELEQRKEALRQAYAFLQKARERLEAMKKLKEKQAEEWKIEQDKLEQKINDEKVTLKYAAEMAAKQNEAELEEDLDEEYA